MSAKRALLASRIMRRRDFVESVALLTLGDFSAGWRGYEARWQVGNGSQSKSQRFTAPPWLGKEPLAGKTILLHAEQGLGDTIQFVRYAPLLAARGAKIVLEVQTELVRLLSCARRSRDLVPATRRCRISTSIVRCISLPLACATELATIPAEIPYIAPAEDESRFGGRACRGGGR